MEAGPYDPANRTSRPPGPSPPWLPQWRRGLTTPQTVPTHIRTWTVQLPQWRRGLTTPQTLLRPAARPIVSWPQWRRGLTTPQTWDGCRRRHLAGGRNGGGALRPRKPAAVVAGRAVVGSRNGGGALRPRKRPLPEDGSLCTSLPQWRRGLTTPQTANSKNES